MVDKEGTDGEKEAMEAYKAARDETDHAAEVAVGDKVSAALIDRVKRFSFKNNIHFSRLKSWLMMGRVDQILTVFIFSIQVDAMLQNLEKEIDDVDAKIGDRWRLLDRCLIDYQFIIILHGLLLFVVCFCMPLFLL